MTASRERKIEYIKSFGPRAFLTLLTEMVNIEGDDFLTDEQIDAMASMQVKDRRFSQHFRMRQKAKLYAASRLVDALKSKENA